MSMRITTKWDINLIPPLWKIVQTIRSRLARVSGTDSEQRVLLSVSAQHLRYSHAAFCDHITASVSHNSIHELPHKRCLNLFAILMSTREPQSDTCREHLLHFSHGFKKEKKKYRKTCTFFGFASQFIINAEFPICGRHFFNFLLAFSRSNHTINQSRECEGWVQMCSVMEVYKA